MPSTAALPRDFTPGPGDSRSVARAEADSLKGWKSQIIREADVESEPVSILQCREPLIKRLFCIAEQHLIVFLMEQGIVDAEVPRGHATLHDDRRLRPPTPRRQACQRWGSKDHQ